MFVQPKLYCYEDVDSKQLIRKASGVIASKLTYDNYVKLALLPSVRRGAMQGAGAIPPKVGPLPSP